NYSIVEAIIPQQYVGKTIQEIGFREKYEILALTILKSAERDTLFGKSRIVTTIMHGIPKPDTMLQEGEIIVIYGSNKNIKEFLQWDSFLLNTGFYEGCFASLIWWIESWMT